MKIHVVYGSSGEWSEREEWVVKAFVDKDEAEKFVLDASAHVRSVSQRIDDSDETFWDAWPVEKAKAWGFWKFDPYFYFDNERCEHLYQFRDTTYSLVETELVQSKPND